MNRKPKFEADAPDFAKIAKNEPNAQKRVRLLAMAQLKSGNGVGQTAKALSLSRSAVGEWYAKYKKYGLKGLDNLPRPGRPPKILRERQKEFIASIEDLQASMQGGRVTGYDIQVMAREKFGADYADDSIYTVLKRLCVVWITARSKHPKANIESQVDFKKNLKNVFAKSFQKA